MSDDTKRPSHVAYHVREGKDGKSYFNRVGSVFEHKDGEGYNVVLDAVPVDGQVVLRTPAERLGEMKQDRDRPRARTRERRADYGFD